LLHPFIKYYLLVLSFLFTAGAAVAQFAISGTVYDSTKTIPVKNVLVKSTSGNIAKTDSLGHYNIVVKEEDSLIFVYRNKATVQFAVNQIENIGSFDISLHVRLYDKVKTLREVRVYSNTYRQDSAKNRQEFAQGFNFEKPGVGFNTSSYSGAAGLDLDQFIDIFRFRRNRMMRSFQKRLIEEEQDKYIDYRFNKGLVKRITRLDGPALDTFMIRYRPDFAFIQTSTTAEFYQYILNASYEFKRELLIQSGKAD
jgi:hypothetical protein